MWPIVTLNHHMQEARVFARRAVDVTGLHILVQLQALSLSLSRRFKGRKFITSST